MSASSKSAPELGGSNPSSGQSGGMAQGDGRITHAAFAGSWMQRHAKGALLRAGDAYAPGHYRLRDALRAMAPQTTLTPDFKLALIPSTRAVEAVYREAQQQLLEGRAPGGETGS